LFSDITVLESIVPANGKFSLETVEDVSEDNAAFDEIDVLEEEERVDTVATVSESDSDAKSEFESMFEFKSESESESDSDSDSVLDPNEITLDTLKEYGNLSDKNLDGFPSSIIVTYNCNTKEFNYTYDVSCES